MASLQNKHRKPSTNNFLKHNLASCAAWLHCKTSIGSQARITSCICAQRASHLLTRLAASAADVAAAAVTAYFAAATGAAALLFRNLVDAPSGLQPVDAPV